MNGGAYSRRKEEDRKCREIKKEEAKQARYADRQRRIQQEVERVIKARVDQGDLVVPIGRDSTRLASTQGH